MKKIILAMVVSLFIGFAPHVFAATGDFVPLAGIPGLTQNVSISSDAGFAGFFNNLYKFLVGFATILAVIEIIWGGLEISTKDSVSKKTDGKKRIYQAIFGLILVLSPVLVFSIINPRILDLNLNISALKLKTTTSTPSSDTTQDTNQTDEETANDDSQLN